MVSLGAKTGHAWLPAAAAILALAAGLAWFDPAYLYNDTFQHISVARNLAAGEGFATSVVYYDEQYAAGRIPAPQTVWPPGMPLAIASLASLGVDVRWAPMWVSIFALIGCVAVLASLGRRLGLDAPRAALLAVTPLAVATNVWIAWRGATEPPYTLCALAALLFTLRASASEGSRFAVVAAAAAALGGALFRNHGVFLAATLAAFFGYEAFRSRSPRVLATALAVLLPAACAYAWLFARNVFYARSFTGGTSAQGWADPLELSYAAMSAVVSLIGVGVRSPARLAATLAIGGMIGACIVRAAWRAYSLDRGSDELCRSDPRKADLIRRVIVFCLLHIGITAAGLVVWAAQRAPEMLIHRYLLPLVPFVALLCAAAWSSSAPAPRHSGRSIRALARAETAAVVLAGLAAAHFAAVAGEVRAWRDDPGVRNLLRSFDAEVSGEPFLEFLRRQSAPDHPVLSSSAQMLAGWVDAPVLGLAPRPYSAREWQEHEVRALVVERGIAYVVVHTADTDGGSHGGRRFFEELRAGRVPPWLEEYWAGEHFTIYSVTRGEGAKRSAL